MSIQDKNNLFLAVIERHKGILYKVANSYCKGDEDRKDLIQEIIFQLWKSFEKYDETHQYSTWIYRISLNVAISFYREESTRTKILNPLSEGVFNLSDSHSFDEKESNLTTLQQFIAELKDLDKALMLLYLEEKSYKEMAEIMGISESNVATKIARIKVKLKEKFSQLKSY